MIHSAPYEYTLEGGAPNEGRNVFKKSSIAPCIRCHVSDGAYTGEPGPLLYGIASKVDSKYLLESIIKPSNRMTEGFEMAIVTTKTNDILVGFVSSETEESLSLKLSDGTSKAFSKSEIATRQTARSTMPENFSSSLSRTDLRNLIAYLKTLVAEPVKLHQDIEEYR